MSIESLIIEMREELREMQRQADKANARVEVWSDTINRLELALVRVKAGPEPVRRCLTCLHCDRDEATPPCHECFGLPTLPNWEPEDA